MDNILLEENQTSNAASSSVAMPPGVAPWAWAVAQKTTAEQMDAVRNHFSSDGHGGLRLGSDCTGANAVFYGLRALCPALGLLGSFTPNLINSFGSEGPDKMAIAPLKFLQVNAGRPEICFRDVCQRGKSGPCYWPSGEYEVPETDIYQAGSVCRDLSRMNRLSPKDMDAILSAESGKSSRTFHGSLKYLEINKPGISFLENTLHRRALKVMIDLVLKLGYLVLPIITNSRHWGLLSSRTRMYLLLLDPSQYELRVPMKEWVGILEQFATCMPRQSLDDILLPDTDPLVQQMHKEMSERRRKHLGSEPGEDAEEKSHEDYERDHAAVIEAMAKRGVTIPSVEEYCKTTPWAKCLTRAQAKILIITHMATKHLANADPHEMQFAWDLQNSLRWARKKHPSAAGTLPCMLTTHLIWLSKSRRPMAGFEQMLAQGFPKEDLHTHDPHAKDEEAKEASRLKDKEWRHLSGDTQTVPVVGTMVLVALMCTRKRETPITMAMEERSKMQQEIGGPYWIGPTKYDKSTEMDDIFRGLGLPPKKNKNQRKIKKAAAATARKLLSRRAGRQAQQASACTTPCLKRPAQAMPSAILKRPAKAPGARAPCTTPKPAEAMPSPAKAPSARAPGPVLTCLAGVPETPAQSSAAEPPRPRRRWASGVLPDCALEGDARAQLD